VTAPLLEIRDLKVELALAGGPACAVDGISFRIGAGETLGLVGESGCGKSLTALAIMRLLGEPTVRIASGEVRFEGEDLAKAPESRLRQVRGDRISMVFQEPMTSLNPVFTVGEQIAEAVRLHRGLKRDAAKAHALEMLRKVGIPAPEARLESYPHQLSGGMRQRVMIAMALALSPKLLVADEPTTALDVTIQAQILNLIRSLQAEQGTAVLLITHDLGVVAETCERVAVMYAGRIVETGPTAQVFARPAHPYTLGLLRSIPDLDAIADRRKLEAIPGIVPGIADRPSGCRFRDRCPKAQALCAQLEPALDPVGPDQLAACHFPETQEAEASPPTQGEASR
jgi:oligopeptide/dipeptide ABC transporter ATP-binding protein